MITRSRSSAGAMRRARRTGRSRTTGVRGGGRRALRGCCAAATCSGSRSAVTSPQCSCPSGSRKNEFWVYLYDLLAGGALQPDGLS